MREMSQLILLESGEGYLIKLPEGSTGKIKLNTVHAVRAEKQKIGKHHEMVKATLDEFIKPVTFDEDTDPILRENYKKLFSGEGKLGGWYISCIRIAPGYISIEVDASSAVSEAFCLTPIEPESHLKFTVEAPNLDGEIDIYTVDMSSSPSRERGQYYRELIVHEPRSVNGTRDIVLEKGVWLKQTAKMLGIEDDCWMLAQVIERR